MSSTSALGESRVTVRERLRQGIEGDRCLQSGEPVKSSTVMRPRKWREGGLQMWDLGRKKRL